MKTIKQFAKDHCISRATVYRLIDAGKVTAVKIGRRTVITPENEAAFRASLQTIPAKVAK